MCFSQRTRARKGRYRDGLLSPPSTAALSSAADGSLLRKADGVCLCDSDHPGLSGAAYRTRMTVGPDPA